MDISADIIKEVVCVMDIVCLLFGTIWIFSFSPGKPSSRVHSIPYICYR